MTNTYFKEEALNGVALTGFEGPEKRLELDFRPNPERPEGLRGIDKELWQEMLNLAKCTIISHTKNEYFDAFVLSESSLFVYPTKVLLKTCGTTTLLKCIPKILDIGTSLDMMIEFVMFSRKNYVFPSKQVFPHVSWDAEVTYLNTILDGNSYVLGPHTRDHWHLYIADFSENTRLITSERTLEIMMHNLDSEVTEQFYKKDETEEKDKFPGMADIIPGSETDEFNFSPCGYSMNGLNNENYYTIHVTPEAHCSYASFETNLSLPSYNALIAHVLDIFKPGTATVVLFAERSCADLIPRNPLQLGIAGYSVKHRSINELEENCDVTMVNLVSDAYAAKKKKF